jgi:hypothetical protein
MYCSIEVSMRRREFLKIIAITAVAPLIPLGLVGIRPAEAAVNGMVYRADASGRILTSSDAGKTWQLHTHFGPQYSIIALTVDAASRVRARIGFSGHSFDLILSQKGKFWETFA